MKTWVLIKSCLMDSMDTRDGKGDPAWMKRGVGKILLFNHLLSRYELGNYSPPNTVLGAGDIPVKKKAATAALNLFPVHGDIGNT